MPFTKTTWTDGDIVSADDLNRIEQGIDDNDTQLVALANNLNGTKESVIDLGFTRTETVPDEGYLYRKGVQRSNLTMHLNLGEMAVMDFVVFLTGNYTLTVDDGHTPATITFGGAVNQWYRIRFDGTGSDVLVSDVQIYESSAAPITPPSTTSNILVASGAGTPGTLAANTFYVGFTTLQIDIEPGSDLTTGTSEPVGLAPNQIHYKSGTFGRLTFQTGGIITTQTTADPVPTTLPTHSIVLVTDKAGVPSGFGYVGSP
jgi:hypothetical protein